MSNTLKMIKFGPLIVAYHEGALCVALICPTFQLDLIIEGKEWSISKTET